MRQCLSLLLARFAATASSGCGLAGLFVGSVFGLLAGCQDRNVDGTAERAARAPSSASPAALMSPPAARYVKLEAVSEWNGQPWAAIAELWLIDATGAEINRTAWKVSASSSAVNDLPANAIDGNPGTIWHTKWEGEPTPPPHSITIDLGTPTRLSGFRYLPRQDGNINGAIGRYQLFVSPDGLNWSDPVAAGDFAKQGPPTAEKTVTFATVSANQKPSIQAIASQNAPSGRPYSLTIVASDADGDPLTFRASGLPPGISIAPKSGLLSGTPILPGAYESQIEVADSKGAASTVTVGWTISSPPPIAGDAAPRPGESRFVKLEAVSELNGKAWSSVSELHLIDQSGADVDRSGWVASADSADVSDKPENAIDGNPMTHWHTQWDGAAPPPPHVLIVDMGRWVQVRGFRYLPRQDALQNGMISRFRFFTSADGIAWSEPVAQGDFATMGSPKSEKKVLFR